MSMNPARTFASAAVSGNWTALWIYFTAPTIAMLAASEFFVRTRGLKSVLCAKLDHFGAARCIFNCGMSSERELQLVSASELERAKARTLNTELL
jgi:aquaporin Z